MSVTMSACLLSVRRVVLQHLEVYLVDSTAALGAKHAAKISAQLICQVSVYWGVRGQTSIRVLRQ